MPTRIILVGGFLGSGKTTLLWQAANRLTAQGIRVGLITNDQGHNLVDTAMLGQQHEVTEVAGGCFCCNFPDLMTSIRQLQDRIQPEVILAEPVGSCTDIVATVIRPLQKYHKEQFIVAPFTVLVDPLRDPASFEPDVNYLYRQQMAEAEAIVLSKSDLLTAVEIHDKVSVLQDEYSPQQVIALSSKTGDAMDAWLEMVLAEESLAQRSLDIDYAIYAAAEAALGWLNTYGTLQTDSEPRLWSENLLKRIEQVCHDRQVAIAHVKLHLRSSDKDYKASLTQTDGTISWDIHPGNHPEGDVNFILNARAHTSPDELEQIVREAIHAATPAGSARAHLHHFECFSPLPPQPTYHIGLHEL